MLSSIPLEKMLLESDAPSMFNSEIYENEDEYQFYFKDEKNQIKNHPISIVSLSKKIADLRKIPYIEFVKLLNNNYNKLIEHLLI